MEAVGVELSRYAYPGYHPDIRVQATRERIDVHNSPLMHCLGGMQRGGRRRPLKNLGGAPRSSHSALTQIMDMLPMEGVLPMYWVLLCTVRLASTTKALAKGGLTYNGNL